MTLAILASRALAGLNAPAVRVETHLGPGLPAFNIVGLPDTEVRESRERVRAALINSGFEFPSGRITVNLSPADLPKASARFDLPMALGLLLASGQLVLPEEVAIASLARSVFAGELSLTGALVPVSAPLPLALGVARDCPDSTLILPAASAGVAAWVPGLRVLAASTLAEVVAHLAGQDALPRAEPATQPAPPPGLCLGDVRGQPVARRVLEICAAGQHSLLMVGPPGAGKSMLARRLPGLLPPLETWQSLEAAALASLVGAAAPPGAQPPFRAPHHTLSSAALVGGGGIRGRPGEISLAHHGVLFLDELPEYNRRALESLREPLETGEVDLSRAAYRIQYPARFQLVAAMNPCPCGWRGHPMRPCRCTPDQVARYAGKVSGPLLDRIDLHLAVPPADPALLDQPPGEPSASVRERVIRCREKQMRRQGCVNAVLHGEALDAYCVMEPKARSLLQQTMRKLDGSARALHRSLRVARTLADLDAADKIDTVHVAEAVQYRLSG